MAENQDELNSEENGNNQPYDDEHPAEQVNGNAAGSDGDDNDDLTSGEHFSADLSHIESSNISMAGKNVIHIRVDSAAQAREIYKTIREEEFSIPFDCEIFNRRRIKTKNSIRCKKITRNWVLSRISS